MRETTRKRDQVRAGDWQSMRLDTSIFTKGDSYRVDIDKVWNEDRTKFTYRLTIHNPDHYYTDEVHYYKNLKEVRKNIPGRITWWEEVR